ncbi:MAG: hypothetical protein ACXVEF_14700 [Polyangiales bacterium]
MKRTAFPRCLCVALLVVSAIGCAGAAGAGDETGQTAAPLEPMFDLAGIGETTHTSGAIDRSNPFFQSLGTNGRTCNSCHDARAGWTMTPLLARVMFELSGGTSTLFRPHDEANRPDADVSTVDARRAAYSMLLSKGLTRFTRVPSATADYTVVAVDDPYGFSTPTQISNFRRPVPVANVALEASITWTGGPGEMRTLLMNIMNGGTKFHAQATTDLPLETRAAAADFMLGLFFAQSYDFGAGRLDAAGAFGGSLALSTQPFYIGINALSGDSKTGAPFDRESFKAFEAWEDLDAKHAGRDTWQTKARSAIARGEQAFYSIEFDISGVAGLNDVLGQPVIRGTCTTCHNTPNVGSSSVFQMLDTGTADAALRTADIPLLTVKNNLTGETKQTTDLGRGLSTAKWADLGKFKVPTLRGLAARPPYFHNGSAANLHQVLDFYKKRFGVDFKGSEEDLIAFLESI